MDLNNGTVVHKFILLGFGVTHQKRLLLFIFFTILYILTLAENITIIALVLLDAKLAQIPMYILLSNFSWLEICYVSTTVPRMLIDLLSTHGIISFRDCFLQYYIFFSLGATECFFLSAMALDRYLAICHSLRYPQHMTQKFCFHLVAVCWVLGFLWFLVPTVMISKLSYCGPNTIDHFLCDPGPLLSLACPPLKNAPLVSQFFMNVMLVITGSFVVLSYGSITLTLMKASGSHRKAYSTISFHILVVTLFYGSVARMYSTTNGESHSEVTKVVTLFYSAVTPCLNPLIYCLRNDQVKEAISRLWKRKEKWMKRKVAA